MYINKQTGVNTKLVNHLHQIFNDLNEYVYVNYFPYPFIKSVDVEWHNVETYNTLDILNVYRNDLYTILTNRGIWQQYLADGKLNKYIVIPDVMSLWKVPETLHVNGLGGIFNKYNHYYDNVFDTDKNVLLIMNDKVFDLRAEEIDHYVFNYSGKTYIFYDETQDNIGMFSSSNKLSFIHISSMLGSTENKATEINPIVNPNQLDFYININNRISDPTIEPCSRFSINEYPYLEFDFTGNTILETSPDVPGLKSTHPLDQFTQEKDNYSQFLTHITYHNPDILISNNAIIIYKDKSYKIIDMSNTNIVDPILEKIDKHTVKLKKDINVEKIYLWIRRFDKRFYDAIKPDTIYDYVNRVTDIGPLLMKDVQIRTNSFRLNIFSKTYDSLEDLYNTIVDYGYKYDINVLKVIQNAFSPTRNIKKVAIKVIDKNEYGVKYYIPRIKFNFRNLLQFKPTLFFKGKLFEGEYKVVESNGYTSIILDPKHIGMNNVTLQTTVEEVEEFININYFDNDFKIMMLPNLYYDINKKSLINYGTAYIDNINSHATLIENNNLSLGNLFVNGFLNNTDFTKNNELCCRLDSVHTFDMGPLNFDLPTTPPDDNIPSYDGKTNLYFDDTYDNVTTVNMDKNKIKSIKSINFPRTLRALTDDTFGFFQLPDEQHNERQLVCFDTYGMLINNKLQLLNENIIGYQGYNKYNTLNGSFVDDITRIHYIYIPLIDDELNINLEIDKTLLSNNNKSYNQKVFEFDPIENILKAVDMPNVDVDNSIYNPLSTTEVINNKVLTRYYLGPMENQYDTTTFSTEVTPLNGFLINTDGSLGTIPIENQYFIDDIHNGTSLNISIISSSILYNMIYDLYATEDKFYNIIDTSLKLQPEVQYTYNMNDIYKHYIELEGMVCNKVTNVNRVK